MRVITQIEYELCETAYKHIMSVAIAYDKYKNPTDFSKIRIGLNRENGQGERVPSAYFPMAYELARALSKEFEGITPLAAIAHAFAPLNKDKAIKWLFQYCVTKRVQPSEFEINGYIWVKHDIIKPIPSHVAIDYQVAS